MASTPLLPHITPMLLYLSSYSNKRDKRSIHPHILYPHTPTPPHPHTTTHPHPSTCSTSIIYPYTSYPHILYPHTPLPLHPHTLKLPHPHTSSSSHLLYLHYISLYLIPTHPLPSYPSTPTPQHPHTPHTPIPPHILILAPALPPLYIPIPHTHNIIYPILDPNPTSRRFHEALYKKGSNSKWHPEYAEHSFYVQLVVQLIFFLSSYLTSITLLYLFTYSLQYRPSFKQQVCVLLSYITVDKGPS